MKKYIVVCSLIVMSGIAQASEKLIQAVADYRFTQDRQENRHLYLGFKDTDVWVMSWNTKFPTLEIDRRIGCVWKPWKGTSVASYLSIDLQDGNSPYLGGLFVTAAEVGRYQLFLPAYTQLYTGENNLFLLLPAVRFTGALDSRTRTGIELYYKNAGGVSTTRLGPFLKRALDKDLILTASYQIALDGKANELRIGLTYFTK